MKKVLVILILSSFSSISLLHCTKGEKDIHQPGSDVKPVEAIKSFGEYYNMIKKMSPAKKAEYVQGLNGKKITWSVNIVDVDKNEILRKGHSSTNVLEFNDQAAPIEIMLCYTDDNISKIKPNQKATISGTIIADRNMIDLFPCKIIK